MIILPMWSFVAVDLLNDARINDARVNEMKIERKRKKEVKKNHRKNIDTKIRHSNVLRPTDVQCEHSIEFMRWPT